jgi:hypothetical protein
VNSYVLKSPSKTFEGSWDEVIKHGSEIPAGALVRVYVYDAPSDAPEEEGAFQGRRLAGRHERASGKVYAPIWRNRSYPVV